jgi:hypothetical protein
VQRRSHGIISTRDRQIRKAKALLRQVIPNDIVTVKKQVPGEQAVGKSPRWGLVGAAIIPPVLYLVFIFHYAVNALLFDDWNLAPFLHASLNGHFSWGAVWSQYGQPRIPITRIVFLAFASIGSFDVRGPIILSALLLVGGYGALLALAWRYLGRLEPLAVLALGVVWFSLSAVQAALFAFEVGWYVVIAGSVGMLAALVVPLSRRRFWFVVAIVLALISTLGFIQGFVAWPVGLVCLLWFHPRRAEVVGWLVAAAGTAGIYLIGYNFHLTSCAPLFGCRPESPLDHLWTAFRWFIDLLGNTFPQQFVWRSGSPPTHFDGARPVVAGLLLLGTTVFIVIQSTRHRDEERLPVPMLFVLFGLLYDASITWGRFGEGLSGTFISNRYGMGNLMLLTGVVLYGYRRLRDPVSRSLLTSVALIALAVGITVQVVVSTTVGITAAQDTDLFVQGGARFAVNVERIPAASRDCEFLSYIIPPGEIPDARSVRMGEFGGPYQALRREGPPPVLKDCRR